MRMLIWLLGVTGIAAMAVGVAGLSVIGGAPGQVSGFGPALYPVLVIAGAASLAAIRLLAPRRPYASPTATC